MSLAEIIAPEVLGKLVGGALVAGVGVTAAFAVAIVGATRFGEARRDSRAVAAGAYALLTAAGLAVFFGGATFGVVLITTK